jgi:hypothetical protein
VLHRSLQFPLRVAMASGRAVRAQVMRCLRLLEGLTMSWQPLWLGDGQRTTRRKVLLYTLSTLLDFWAVL